MNEIDDEVAKWFAEDEPVADDGMFASAVLRRIARRRRLRRVAKLGLIAALSATATTIAAFAPDALNYPALAVKDLLASPLVALLAGGAMVWWTQSQES